MNQSTVIIICNIRILLQKWASASHYFFQEWAQNRLNIVIVHIEQSCMLQVCVNTNISTKNANHNDDWSYQIWISGEAAAAEIRVMVNYFKYILRPTTFWFMSFYAWMTNVSLLKICAKHFCTTLYFLFAKHFNEVQHKNTTFKHCFWLMRQNTKVAQCSKMSRLRAMGRTEDEFLVSTFSSR